MPNLTILHTNDLHGRLRPEGVEIIRREKESAGDCLLLDAGDAIASGNISYRPGGEPALGLMSEAGYDAMAMGNREFHFLKPGLQSKVKLARFPVLCANMDCGRRGDPSTVARFETSAAPLRSAIEASNRATVEGSPLRPHYIVERGGYRVAIFGLTVPMITKEMLASRFSPYRFEDPIETAKAIVPALRDQADLVIAVTHIGIKADEALAQEVPGIDLIVGGHTHSVLHEPLMIGGTSIVQAGWFAHFLGKVQITGEPGNLSITGSLIPLQPSARSRDITP